MLSKLNLHVENTGVLPKFSTKLSNLAVYRNTAVFIHNQTLTC